MRPKTKHNIIIGDDNMFKVDNEFKSATVCRTVRFTEPLFETLNRVASQNEISFNLLVLQCCKYALENISPADKEGINNEM